MKQTEKERIFSDYKIRKKQHYSHDINILFLDLAAKWKMKVRDIKDIINSFKPDRVITPKFEEINNKITRMLVSLGFNRNVGFHSYHSQNGLVYYIIYTHPAYRKVCVRVFPDDTYDYMLPGGNYCQNLQFTGKNEFKDELLRGCPSLLPMFRGDKIAKLIYNDDEE